MIGHLIDDQIVAGADGINQPFLQSLSTKPVFAGGDAVDIQ